jgi:hypothetical protein
LTPHCATFKMTKPTLRLANFSNPTFDYSPPIPVQGEFPQWFFFLQNIFLKMIYIFNFNFKKSL